MVATLFMLGQDTVDLCEIYRLISVHRSVFCRFFCTDSHNYTLTANAESFLCFQRVWKHLKCIFAYFTLCIKTVVTVAWKFADQTREDELKAEWNFDSFLFVSPAALQQKIAVKHLHYAWKTTVKYKGEEVLVAWIRARNHCAHVSSDEGFMSKRDSRFISWSKINTRGDFFICFDLQKVFMNFVVCKQNDQILQCSLISCPERLLKETDPF